MATTNREGDLHIAVCQAVTILNNGGEARNAHSILREALVDYADAKAAVPAGVLKTNREAWLLNEVSSATRLTIGVEQYEELRVLANRLARATPSPDAAARVRAILANEVALQAEFGMYPGLEDFAVAIATALTASEAEVIERCIGIIDNLAAEWEVKGDYGTIQSYASKIEAANEIARALRQKGQHR